MYNEIYYKYNCIIKAYEQGKIIPINNTFLNSF